MANKYTKTPYPDKKDLQALYDWGLTQRSLAIHYNVTQKIIWRWMRDLGIKARVPKNNKQRLSVSVSTKTLELIDESLRLEKFRNKSHAVEFSINKTLRKQE